MSRIQQVSIGGYDALDADAVLTAQAIGAGGSITLDGALVSGGVATFDNPRKLYMSSAGDESARTVTITGTDRNGQVIQEVMAGSNTTKNSVLDYLTITDISIDAATAGAVAFGTSDIAASAWIPMDLNRSPFNASIVVEVTGTINYTVQYAFINNTAGVAYNIYDDEDIVLHNHDDSNLVATASTAVGNYAFPCTHTRLHINSGINSGSAVLKVIQCGV